MKHWIGLILENKKLEVNKKIDEDEDEKMIN